MSLLRKAIIFAAGASNLCRFLLGTSYAESLGYNPADLIGDQGFEVNIPSSPSGSETYAVNSSLSYNVGDNSKDGPVISVFQFIHFTAQAGDAFIRIENGSGSSKELYFDGQDTFWRARSNGSEVGSATSLGVSNEVANDVNSHVIFRIYPNGDYELCLNEFVVLSGSGAAGWDFETVQMVYGLYWDSVNSPSDGHKLTGYVYTNANDPDLEIKYAQNGDYNWCGTELFIEAEEEPASNQTFTLASNTTFLERHATIDILDGGNPQEDAANQTFTLASDTTFLERHQQVEVIDNGVTEESASNQTFTLSSGVSFLERHTTE